MTFRSKLLHVVEPYREDRVQREDARQQEDEDLVGARAAAYALHDDLLLFGGRLLLQRVLDRIIERLILLLQLLLFLEHLTRQLGILSLVQWVVVRQFLSVHRSRPWRRPSLLSRFRIVLRVDLLIIFFFAWYIILNFEHLSKLCKQAVLLRATSRGT